MKIFDRFRSKVEVEEPTDIIEYDSILVAEAANGMCAGQRALVSWNTNRWVPFPQSLNLTAKFVKESDALPPDVLHLDTYSVAPHVGYWVGPNKDYAMRIPFIHWRMHSDPNSEAKLLSCRQSKVAMFYTESCPQTGEHLEARVIDYDAREASNQLNKENDNGKSR